MKKRLVALLLAFAMVLSMSACGNAEGDTKPEEQKKEEISTNRPATSYDNSSLEGIIVSIEADFADSEKFLEESYAKVTTATGETYEGYVENKQVLTDWYELVLSEEKELMGRTRERAVEYLKLISSSIDHEDDDAIEEAMDEYYDRIYEGVMDDFYDDVYEDLLDEAYDMYYDGMVQDGYDIVAYDKWYDESSAAYKEWYNTSSATYKEWYHTSSTLYGYWYRVNSGFYKGDFDVEAIIEAYEKEKATEEAAASEEAKNEEAAKEGNSDDIRPEFKEAMESYEAFFDEYVEFMNEYSSAGAEDMVAMMDDYTEYMKQYVDAMEKFEELESGDMTADEAIYYAEVSSRIYEKILEIEY